MDNIKIFTSANENYAPGLIVMIASALSSLSKKVTATFYVLNDGLTGNTTNSLQKLIRYFPKSHIEYLHFDGNEFSNYNIGPGNSYLAYGRLLIGSFVDSKKVIYIDADMLILKDLSKIWNQDMGGKAILACQDDGVKYLRNDCEWPLNHIDKNKYYFNSGFMVIDLLKWQTMEIEKNSLKLGRERECKLWDQTILNYLLKDEVKYIDNSWNFQNSQKLQNELKNISEFGNTNYHYSSMYKPWDYYFKKNSYKLWRIYYSKFIGSAAVSLISRKKYIRFCVWIKEYIIQNNSFINQIYHQIRGFKNQSQQM